MTFELAAPIAVYVIMCFVIAFIPYIGFKNLRDEIDDLRGHIDYLDKELKKLKPVKKIPIHEFKVDFGPVPAELLTEMKGEP